MPKRQPAVTAALVERYLKHLREQEQSAATLQKYAHDLKELCAYLQGAPLTKATLIAWKEQLTGKYALATVNSMLTATNGYLRFYGWCSCRRNCGCCCALITTLAATRAAELLKNFEWITQCDY